MAEMNIKTFLVMLGLVFGLGLMILALITLFVTGQVSFFIFAIIDDSLWTDDLKYINASAPLTPGVNETGLNDPDNLRDVYAQSLIARDQALDDLNNTLENAALIVGLIGLVVVVVVFFIPGGILDMIRGISRPAKE